MPVTRGQMLKLAPIAAAMATGVGATMAREPTTEGKGKCLVLVDVVSGLCAKDVRDALNHGDPFLEHDGVVAHPVEVLWIPDGAKIVEVQPVASPRG